jgi:site-specific DNA recombinase
MKVACSRSEPFDILLIESWSRLSRDWAIRISIIRHLEQAGIEVRTTDTKNTEATQPPDMPAWLIGEFHEPRMRSDRRHCRLMRARAGDWVDAAPYGYFSVRGTNSRRILEIHENEAKVVRHAFHLAWDRNGAIAIANHLNEAGYKTRRGGRWSAATVRRLVQNPVYAGRASKKIPLYPSESSECITVRIVVPPIIPTKLFLDVQCVRRRARRVRATDQSIGPNRLK